MKRQFFIIAISFLLFPVLGNSQSDSQSDFKLGLFMGLNYAHPEGDYIEDTKEMIEDNIDSYDDSDYYDLDINRGGVIGRVGIHLGVSAEYAVKENVSLMTSISYSQKGFYIFNKIEGEYASFYDGDVDIMEKTTIKAKLDYIDIPFLIKYNLNSNVYVFGGPLLSFLITEDDTVEYKYDEEWDGDDDSDSETYDWDEAWSSSDDLEDRLSGFQIGIGFNKGNYDLLFKLNNNSDFGEIYGDDDNKNITFQFSTGFEF